MLNFGILTEWTNEKYIHGHISNGCLGGKKVKSSFSMAVCQKIVSEIKN